MSANVDLHFCDLCGLSIPQKDLDSGLAKLIKNKSVGVCCLSLILEPAAPGRVVSSPKVAPATPAGKAVGSGGLPAGSTALFPTALLLVALAASAAFVEWRAGNRSSRQRSEMRTLATQLAEAQKSVDEVDAKVTAIPAKAIDAKLLALQSEADRLGQAIQAIKPGDDSAVQARLQQLGLRLSDLMTRFTTLEARQGSLDRSVQRGFQDLAKEMGELGARTPSSARPSGKATMRTDSDAKPSEDPTLALPGDLAKDVGRLSDAEAGVRWAAIDALLSKKDPRVVPHLIPTLKDEDPFIRRLTATGLGKLGDKRAIWPLFDAMSDSESIVRSAAYRSLVKLTKEFGKPLAFDPDASKDKRKNALRKWKDWLEKRLAR